MIYTLPEKTSPSVLETTQFQTSFPQCKKGKKKNVLLAVSNILCSCILLFFLSFKVKNAAPFMSLATIDFTALALSCAAFLLSQLGLLGRQHCILLSMNRRIAGSIIAKSHFVGHSLTQVLPTSVGGDLARFAILRKSGDNGRIIRAVLLSRILGLLTLMASVAISLPYIYLCSDLHDNAKSVLEAFSVFSIAALLSVCLAFRLSHKRVFRRAPRIVRYCVLITRDLSRCLAPRFLMNHVLFSLINIVFMCACFCCMAHGLKYSLSFVSSLIAVPLIILFMFIPVSFAGWGLRELGASSIFPLVGVPAGTAVSLSIGYGFSAQLIALIFLCFLAVLNLFKSMKRRKIELTHD